MLTFYILEDAAVPGAVKVGKDTSWPTRFKQARCHSPGTIRVHATFTLPSMDRQGQEFHDALVKML